MFKNYFKTAWRNIIRNKTTTLINLFGLSVALVAFIFISLWVQNELSFDNFHPDGNAIFRISNTFKSESESFSQAPSGPAFGAQLPKLLSSVKSACRIFNDVNKIKYGNNQFIESNVISVD